MKSFTPYIAAAVLLFLLGSAVFTSGASNVLRLGSLTVDAQAGTCSSTAGRSCALVATFGPDADAANYKSDICYNYNGNFSSDGDFFDTCAEIIASTNCDATNTCDSYYQTEYRVTRSSCQNTGNPADVCPYCDSYGWGVYACSNPGTGGSGGSGGSGVPTVNLVANPVSVASGGSSTLTWTVANATSCSASASPSTSSWSGSRSASGGNELESNITTTRTYTITCSNSYGSAADSATVTVGGVVATFDLQAGVTTPYGQSVTGTDPVNGVDARFNVDITSGCNAQCDFDSNGFYICDYQCSRLEYRVQCKAGDAWRSLGSYFNPENDSNLNRTYANACNYSPTGGYDMKGEVIITKQDPTYSLTTLGDLVPITVNPPVPPPGATCTPSTQTVEVGQSATVIGGVSGQSPITCSWSGGGTPANSNLCNPFTTTYSTPGTKTITFNVNASNGTASCQSTVNVIAGVPDITYDFEADLTLDPASPYTGQDSYTGVAPINGLDGAHLLRINSGCGTSANTFNEWCTIEYLIDCANDGAWDAVNTQSFPNGWNNADWNRYAYNACNYPAGTHYMRGGVRVTPNSNPSATAVATDIVTVNATVANTPAGATCQPTTLNANTGQNVTINGTPSGDSPFTCAWSAPGGSPATGSSCTSFTTSYSSTGAKTITYQVTDADGQTASCQSTVNVTNPSTPAGASCSPTSTTVETNQSVVINGNVSGSSPSCSWTGGGTPGTSSSCNPFSTTYGTAGTKTIRLTVNAGGTTAQCNSTITVNNPAPTPTYTLTAIRNGQGTITSSPAGINCGSTCVGVYDEGTTVVLTATPAAGWSFIEWLGACDSTSANTCTVQINGPRTVTAKFRPNTIYEEF